MQVKLRGMRVEVEDIEAHVQQLAAVSQACVLVRGEGPSAQLVAFVATSSASGGAAVWDERGARMRLAAELPAHMIPARFVLVDQMPYTSSGKVDRRRLMELDKAAAAAGFGGAGDTPVVGLMDGSELMPVEGGASAFLASRHIKELKLMGLDSIGIVRAYNRLVASAEVLAAESRVAEIIRAVCMLGVAVDHIAACGPRSPCLAVARLAFHPRMAPADGGMLTSELLLRAMGNYKTVAGFAMSSAYMDSALGDAALAFSKTDAAILLVYLQMAWVLDPTVTAIAARCGIATLYPWWLATHRWYLLAMLYTRAAMVLMHFLRLPPAAQVLAAATALFISPDNIGCISTVCAGLPTVQNWMDWTVVPQPFPFIFQVCSSTGTLHLHWQFKMTPAHVHRSYTGGPSHSTSITAGAHPSPTCCPASFSW